MTQIVVVGSANTDLILRCEHLPRAGETVLGREFAMVQGGKGANQAVAAARLGAHVTFVARLGRDAMGNRAEASYLNEGIHCDFISRDDNTASGVALIMVDAAGENLIGVGPGANYTLAPEHVTQAEAAIRAAQVLLVQLEIPLDTVTTALQLAHKWNTRAILNPAPARALPNELIANAILTPNEHELGLITGLPDIESAARELIARGAQAVIVTLGERGAWLVTPVQSRIIPSFPVNAVDTTATGDAFNGGLAVALARGDNLPDAVRYACACGALAATQFGAQPSLPTATQVAQFLRDAQA